MTWCEEELVTNAYLACRLHQHVPQAQLLVQLTQQKHLYLCVGFLLCTEETCREDLRVIEDEGVALVEIVHDVTENNGFIGFLTIEILLPQVNGAALAVHYHQTAAVALIDSFHGAVLVLKGPMGWVEGNLLFWQPESEL